MAGLMVFGSACNSKETNVSADVESDVKSGESSENTVEESGSGQEQDMSEVPVREKLTWDSTGTYVLFGHYEQDGDTSNGPEPIEWIVLDESDGKMLLLSRFILDHKRYNEEPADELTWETCT